MGYQDAQQGAHARTAFRSAEKRYKRYTHASSHSRSSRRTVPATDLSEVLDMRKIAAALQDDSSLQGVCRLAGPFDSSVYTINGHPGFYFIPEALSMTQQLHWLCECLRTFPQPPNRTNHNALYGPIQDLWSAAQMGKVLVKLASSNQLSFPASRLSEDKDMRHKADAGMQKNRQPTVSCECTSHLEGHDSTTDHFDLASSTPEEDVALFEFIYVHLLINCSTSQSDGNGKTWQFCERTVKDQLTTLETPVSAETLLRKLRWATLGLQFDWSKRAYDESLAYRDFPKDLAQLATRLAEPAVGEGQFEAEAAIVNYYGPDDILGGHVDDMEADWSKPIVSISLGCKAVFLLGGPSRDQPPTAMYLRSGDVVLMAGPARHCFHGVPRIL